MRKPNSKLKDASIALASFCIKNVETFLIVVAYNEGNGNHAMTVDQEKSLIAEICDGSGEQYRYLVERYHRGLIQHVFNFVHDGDMAEDIAQEAFIQAYIKLRQYDDTYAFSTWLYKIADNLAKRALAKSRQTTSMTDYDELIPDARPPTEEIIDDVIGKARIRKAVDHLPSAQRRAIMMYYWDELSYEEIAHIMERPVGTIRTWLHRAKEQLRKELAYGQQI